MKKMNKIRICAIALVAAMMGSACTEKIDLPLKTSEPQLVIEGNISDKPGPYYVILTKSKFYYEDNLIEGVSGAQLVINDDAGNVDTLVEVIAGLYSTQTIQGTIGRTYHLQVIAENKQYDASCKMQTPVDIDSIAIENRLEFNGDSAKRGRVYFTDPFGVRNFYRIISYQNEEQSKGFNLHNDRLWDGKQRNYGVSAGNVETGDTLQVDLLSLDEKIYNYFVEIDANSGFAQPAAPSTPTGIFTPATLGYFSAHSIKSKTIIVP